MRPFINLQDIKEFEEADNGDFKSRYATISERIGAVKLGYSMTEVPPGKKVCPFHNHHINEEMFLILDGVGILRFGKEEYPLKALDIIACPPGGREVAHQILNTGSQVLKYLSLSTNEPQEICEYPDSDKLLVMARHEDKTSNFRYIGRLEDRADYFEDEK